MILRFILLIVILPALNNSSMAQSEQTFYRTNSTYEAYQLDKAPFAMKKVSIIPKDESITIGGITFSKAQLKDGSFMYLSDDRKSYLLVIDKNDQIGFIVSPNGKDWSCYFRYKKGRKENEVPPDDNSNEEVGYLKEALGKLVDPRTNYYYLSYSGFESRNSTNFAKDSLAVIFASPDTILIAGNTFIRKTDRVFKLGAYTYLYMPDKETMVFRGLDFKNQASFYKNSKQNADRLIGEGYKSEKELIDANIAIDNMENSKTKNVLDTYFRNLQSARNDQAFAGSILKFWNAHSPHLPAQKVIFIDQDFHITRNNLGQTMRRTIAAWVIYSKNGKCYAQWHDYGYESANGTFVNELSQWRMETYIIAQSSGGTEYLHSNEEFEINCKQ